MRRIEELLGLNREIDQSAAGVYCGTRLWDDITAENAEAAEERR